MSSVSMSPAVQHVIRALLIVMTSCQKMVQLGKIVELFALIKLLSFTHRVGTESQAERVHKFWLSSSLHLPSQCFIFNIIWTPQVSAEN